MCLYIYIFLELNIMNRRGPVLQIISLSKVVKNNRGEWYYG